MRIAVCLSGETRTFNLKKEGHRNPADFIDELKKFCPQVDVYGHTWAHCEEPVTERFVFAALMMEDQNIISEWVKEDFVNRAYSNRSGWNQQVKLSDMTPEEYVEKSLARSRQAYGQVFSGFKCFSMVPVNYYDVVIRYRWDLEHIGDTEHFEKTVVRKIKWLVEKQAQGYPFGVATSNSWIGSGHPPTVTMEDTFFMINALGHEYLISTTIQEKLETVFEQAWGNEKSEAHSLWTDCIFTSMKNNTWAHRISFNLELPNMFNLFRIVSKNNEGNYLN